MWWRWVAVLGLVFVTWITAASAQQQGQTEAPPATNSTESEVWARNAGTVFKVHVDLVQVRVVVKDSKGKPVPGLSQEDFQIWDNGKRQKISAFSMETAETPNENATVETPTAGTEAKGQTTTSAGNAPAMPQRFVALVVDDLHMKAADAMAVHDATKKLFASLTPADRVAIYSTSGSVRQNFTGDPETLRNTLAAIVPHSRKGEAENYCPNVSYYQADLIVNKHDREAAMIASIDAEVNGCPVDIEQYATRILQAEEPLTRAGYETAGQIVRQLAGMPGQRVLVYVSPGFVLPDEFLSSESVFIERAIRAGVVINTIDARGLYTADLMPDINAPPQQSPYKSSTADYQGPEGRYRMQAQFVSGQVLAEMAANTGGTYIHNRNDLGTGMSEALATPSVSYLLGFAPDKPAKNGKFHYLTVKVVNGKKYQIQARNGYYPSNPSANPEDMAKEQVREAVFSQGETVSVPVQLKTELLGTGASAKLTVVTNLDIRGLQFRKEDGRSCNDLVWATGVFDTNGQLVDSQMKEITLRLTDSTLGKMSQTGLTIRSVFTLKPGNYMVRSVVRGSEGNQLTSRNLMTVIPSEQANNSQTKSEKKGNWQNARWTPPKVDAPLKSLSATPPCNLAEVLGHTAVSSQALASNLEKFTAEEHIEYLMLDRDGMVEDYDSGSFQYVYSIEKHNDGIVSREYRTPVKGSRTFRGSGQEIGHGALALIFSPDLQTDYEMKCEGLDQRNGQDDWVVHFQQRKDRPSRTVTFWLDGASHPGMFEGRAWISKDDFQIVHLEASLMGGLRDIGLLNLALSVDYTLVQPSSAGRGLELPSRTASYWNFDAHRVIMVHSLSDFQFFTVETDEKVQEPKKP